MQTVVKLLFGQIKKKNDPDLSEYTFKVCDKYLTNCFPLIFTGDSVAAREKRFISE